MYRSGKPTAPRVSATSIQKTNRPSTGGLSNGSTGVGGGSSSSGMKGVVENTKPSTPSSKTKQASLSSVRSSSSSQPQPSKSPSNIGKNNQISFHYRSSEDKSRESNHSRIEEEDDDDMEIMSVNDQHQYLKDINKSNQSNSSINKSKDQNSSIKSTRSSRSSKSTKSNLSEMMMSDDSLPLKLKKKVQIETPREREYRDSVSSIHSTPIEEHDDTFGDEHSVSNSNNSLHILTSVRKKLKDEEGEEEHPVNTNTRPSRIAEYIKRFRTSPPTQRSDRKRLEFADDKEEVQIPMPRNERRRIPEPEPSVRLTGSREDNKSWMKRAMQSSIESSHPSIRNINQLKESIKQEIMDVEENIEHAKRYSTMDMEDDESQGVSTRDQFSYMDTLDFDINELNNITDMALENGSFKMFGNVENILSKLSNDRSNNQSNDSAASKKNDAADMSDSSDEEKLDEMFRKGVLSRLQSIGLHESYLDLESYDILSESPKKEDIKIENQVEELMKERNQVEKLLKGNRSRENSIVSESNEKEMFKPVQVPKQSNSSMLSTKSSNSSKVEEEKPSPKNSKYEISIDQDDMEEGFFPVVTIKSENTAPVVSQSIESFESNNSGFESRQLEFLDEEELIQRQRQNELTPPMVTESIDSLLAKSIESVSSVSSANDNDMSSMGYCQRMIEQMVSSETEQIEEEEEEEKPVIETKQAEKKEKKEPVVDINDDTNELFTSDYICQTLRQKIDQLKNRLAELEKKDALLK